MDETLYKIEFDGELSEGYAEEEVKNELRIRFKLEEKKIDRMFSGDPLILKKGIGKQDAEQFIKSFLDIGVICTLHPLTSTTEFLPEESVPPVEEDVYTQVPPVPDPPVEEIEQAERSLLSVREVLGFTGRGLKNPESDVRLIEKETPGFMEGIAGLGSAEESSGPELSEPVETDHE